MTTQPDSLARECLALVMAGGRGNRLAPLTEDDCKPAVPFGASARIIDYTLSNCLNSGINRVGVVTQFRQHSLLSHLQRGWGFLNSGAHNSVLELLPAQQDKGDTWYCGTADAIYRNIAFIEDQAPRHVIILSGDHVYKADYREMLSHHVSTGAEVTVSCDSIARSVASRFGVAAVGADHRIEGFVEKPSVGSSVPGTGDTVLASMGIYIFNTPCLLDALRRDAADEHSSHDFGHDILPRLIQAREVVAYPFAKNTHGNYWRDVGTLDSYFEAHMDLLDADDAAQLHDASWPVHSWRAGSASSRIINAPITSRVGDSLLGDGCTIRGATVQRSILSPACTVEPRARVFDSILLPGSSVGAGCHLRRVILQRNVSLPANSVIGLDPVADARRFPASEAGVVVVTRDALAAIESAGELAALCMASRHEDDPEEPDEPSRRAA